MVEMESLGCSLNAMVLALITRRTPLIDMTTRFASENTALKIISLLHLEDLNTVQSLENLILSTARMLIC